MLEILSTVFVVRGKEFECATSIGDFYVAITDRGAVYAMKCREKTNCLDCVEMPLDGEISVYLPKHIYNCLGCILGEFFNAGLFNLSLEGVVVAQKKAYVVPPMAKERDAPERLIKRAGGILENYVLKILSESFRVCCKF